LRELVVTRGDAAPVFEPAETAFDDIAVLVSFLVVTDFSFAIGFAGDNGLDAMLFEESPDRVRVIALVGEEFLGPCRRGVP
jgi:hypothetical protein